MAPNQIFKKGSTVDLTAGDIHAGIEGGFVQDPNKPEVEAKKEVIERATSKKHKEKRWKLNVRQHQLIQRF